MRRVRRTRIGNLEGAIGEGFLYTVWRGVFSCPAKNSQTPCLGVFQFWGMVRAVCGTAAHSSRCTFRRSFCMSSPHITSMFLSVYVYDLWVGCVWIWITVWSPGQVFPLGCASPIWMQPIQLCDMIVCLLVRDPWFNRHVITISRSVMCFTVQDLFSIYTSI